METHIGKGQPVLREEEHPQAIIVLHAINQRQICVIMRYVLNLGPRLVIRKSELMSPKLPRITVAELLRALRRDGWQEARHRGHIVLKHSAKRGPVVVPYHSGKTIHPDVLKSILDQAGLTADELRDLL